MLEHYFAAKIDKNKKQYKSHNKDQWDALETIIKKKGNSENFHKKKKKITND